MMKIHTLTLGAYQTNTYIVHEETSKKCCVIDPGYESKTILSHVNKLGLEVEAILLTHGHFDHVGAVEEIVKATNCKLWMRESDWARPKDPINAYFYPIANCAFAEVQFCKEGAEIAAGGLTFRVLETPGHTRGSVCYLCENVMFSGDTLFAEGFGRTDLPGGDWSTLTRSLERLSKLESNYTVYPGHGGSTTLAWEKRYNPYMS